MASPGHLDFLEDFTEGESTPLICELWTPPVIFRSMRARYTTCVNFTLVIKDEYIQVRLLIGARVERTHVRNGTLMTLEAGMLEGHVS